MTKKSQNHEWFAIRTRQDFKAEIALSPFCEDILFPKEIITDTQRKKYLRALIPRVLFIKTTREKALELEMNGRLRLEQSIPFWIYRLPNDEQIQAIPESYIELLRLLTTEDTTRWEIFNKTDFKENQHVRITGGDFIGYEGYIVRVKKNKHVVVKIEGVCAILLPFIKPDFLTPIN